MLIFALVSLGVFIGFVFLARYNRKHLALVILGLEVSVLLAWLVGQAFIEHDVERVAAQVAVIVQTGYVVASLIGWPVGRFWRKKALQA